MASLIPQYELSMMQRVLLIYAFIFCGMTIGFRAAQQYTERPYPWTQLNDRTRFVWVLFSCFYYLLKAAMFRGGMEERGCPR